MTASQLTANDVAQFLKAHPDFFTQHAGLFADLRLPHPQQANTISLVERQIMTLRGRVRELQWQLSGLIDNATGNERISQLLIDWCASLLAEEQVQRLPDHITQGLALLFDLPDIALRLWDLPRIDTHSTAAQPIDEALLHDLTARHNPWCGPADHPDVPEGVLDWLSGSPASVALIPLSMGTPPHSIGMLVLGSSNATRFTEDMGTEFLQTIASLAGAALSRLAGPDAPQTA